MALTLTTDDREWIKLMTKELIYNVTEGVLKKHVEICPHGKLLATSKMFFLGFFIGVGLAGGGVGFTVAKILF